MNKEYFKSLDYALNISSKKRYTERLMEEKLEKFMRKHEICDEEGLINKEIVERLVELKYLNDAKYAKDYVSDKMRFRPKSRFLLSVELKKKGVEEGLINDAFDRNKFNDSEIARMILKKKMKKWQDELPREQKLKAYRFLAGKGFKSDDIYKAVEWCYSTGGAEDL